MNDKDIPVTIERIKTRAEIEFCAHLRASSDPWLTLQRDYDDAIKSITATDHEVYVAKSKDDIMGFAVVSVTGVLIGFLLTLCIVPDYQRLGIGAKLLAYSEERIFKESPNVFLMVSSFNTGAQTFYEKHGYRKIGELENYIIRGYSEFLMRKSIGPHNEFYKMKSG